MMAKPDVSGCSRQMQFSYLQDEMAREKLR